MYEKLKHGLEMCANAIVILLKGYLPISLLLLAKLKEILDELKKAMQITNLDYDIVIGRFHIYRDMKLVKFGINEERNLIVQFPIFVQPYIQKQLILFQIETVPVPIIGLNKRHNPPLIYK